jgi:hypothetical protein
MKEFNMKKIISLTFFLIFASNARANLNYLPQHYLTGEDANTEATTSELKPASDFIDSVLKSESEILESKDSADLTAKDPKKFKMNLMLTNFSISKSGLLGLSAFKANEFVSLFWTRKKPSNELVTEESKEVQKAVQIEGEATEEELAFTATELADSLFSSGLVNNKEALVQNLGLAMKKANEAFGVIETMSYGNWDVSGLRLDLSVSTSGIVVPYTTVGASSRVWIEWRRVKRPNDKKNVTSQGGKKLQDFVSKVLSDVDLSANNINLKSFHLSQMYVGLGQDIKTGFFGLGTANSGFIGYVILNHKKQNASLTKPLLETSDELPVISGTSKLKNVFSVSRRKLRRSIQKTLNLGAKLVDNAEKVKSKGWEISRVRLTTTLSKSGFFGLSSLSTKGVFIHVFDRN